MFNFHDLSCLKIKCCNAFVYHSYQDILIILMKFKVGNCWGDVNRILYLHLFIEQYELRLWINNAYVLFILRYLEKNDWKLAFLNCWSLGFFKCHSLFNVSLLCSPYDHFLFKAYTSYLVIINLHNFLKIWIFSFVRNLDQLNNIWCENWNQISFWNLKRWVFTHIHWYLKNPNDQF